MGGRKSVERESENESDSENAKAKSSDPPSDPIKNEGIAGEPFEGFKTRRLPCHASEPAMTEAQKQEEIKRLLARLKQLRATPRSDWHREFEDALQLDIESWSNGSWVLREVTLGEDAPRIDFIVVSGEKLPENAKSVFRIFRRRNIIEYKGPGDKLTRQVIRKVNAYADFYIGTAKPGEGISEDGVTISIFTASKDLDLFGELEKEGRIVSTDTKGIYTVKKYTDLPFQIVITDELEGKEYAAYRALTTHVDAQDVEWLLDTFQSEADLHTRDRLHRILGLVNVKNQRIVSKIIREDHKMEDVFMEALRPRIDREIEAAVGAAVEVAVGDTKMTTSMNIARNLHGMGMDVDAIARAVGSSASTVHTWLEAPIADLQPA